MNFQEWFIEKEEIDTTANAVAMLVEAARWAYERSPYDEKPSKITSASVQNYPGIGDIILTSADKFLSKKADYSLRVGDLNFFTASPGVTKDFVPGVGVRKIGGKNKNIRDEFALHKLTDVTKAFIDDPHLRPNQRVWVYIKNDSPGMWQKVEKMVNKISDNVPLYQRKEDEQQKEREAHMNALKSLGASHKTIGKAQMANDIQDINNAKLNTRMQQGFKNPEQRTPSFDDLDARINKLKPTQSPEMDDDQWNNLLRSKI